MRVSGGSRAVAHARFEMAAQGDRQRHLNLTRSALRLWPTVDPRRRHLAVASAIAVNLSGQWRLPEIGNFRARICPEIAYPQ